MLLCDEGGKLKVTSAKADLIPLIKISLCLRPVAWSFEDLVSEAFTVTRPSLALPLNLSLLRVCLPSCHMFSWSHHLRGLFLLGSIRMSTHPIGWPELSVLFLVPLTHSPVSGTRFPNIPQHRSDVERKIQISRRIYPILLLHDSSWGRLWRMLIQILLFPAIRLMSLARKNAPFTWQVSARNSMGPSILGRSSISEGSDDFTQKLLQFNTMSMWLEHSMPLCKCCCVRTASLSLCNTTFLLTRR